MNIYSFPRDLNFVQTADEHHMRKAEETTTVRKQRDGVETLSGGGDDSLGQVTFSHPAISSVPVQNDNGSPMAAQSDIHARTQTDSARPRCAAAAMGCCETSQTQVSNLPSFLLLLLLLFVSIHPLLFSIFFLS